VHSIFALVMTFAFTSILLMMEGAEFLSLRFIIVYVGAIAILFLFVVMMLNIRLVELMDNATRYVPIGFIIGITFLGQLTLVNNNQSVRIKQDSFVLSSSEQITNLEHLSRLTPIKTIGQFLYTDG
jgi:NADH-quinone oxidoreductase subunit J